MAEQDATGRWSKNTGEALGEVDRFCAEIQLKLQAAVPWSKGKADEGNPHKHATCKLQRPRFKHTVLQSWSGPSLDCSSICL